VERALGKSRPAPQFKIPAGLETAEHLNSKSAQAGAGHGESLLAAAAYAEKG